MGVSRSNDILLKIVRLKYLYAINRCFAARFQGYSHAKDVAALLNSPKYHCINTIPIRLNNISHTPANILKKASAIPYIYALKITLMKRIYLIVSITVS